MKPSDDDNIEMTFLHESGDGTGGASDTALVTAFLADLRGLGEAPAPPPSPELEALLSGAIPFAPREAGRSSRARRRIALGAAAALLIGGTSAAAATGRLPEPAQRFVSDVVGTVTPFTIPTSAPRDRGPSPAAPVRPGSTQHHLPAPVTSVEPSDAPTQSSPGEASGSSSPDESGSRGSDGGSAGGTTRTSEDGANGGGNGAASEATQPPVDDSGARTTAARVGSGEDSPRPRASSTTAPSAQPSGSREPGDDSGR